MNPSGRVRSREPSLLGDAIEKFLQHSGVGRNLRTRQVFHAWSDALGPALAARAVPVRFERGQLCVQVDSSAHLHELQNFTGERYRADANAILGEQRIRQVVYKLNCKL